MKKRMKRKLSWKEEIEEDAENLSKTLIRLLMKWHMLLSQKLTLSNNLYLHQLLLIKMIILD